MFKRPTTDGKGSLCHQNQKCFKHPLQMSMTGVPGVCEIAIILTLLSYDDFGHVQYEIKLNTQEMIINFLSFTF